MNRTEYQIPMRISLKNTHPFKNYLKNIKMTYLNIWFAFKMVQK